MARKPRRNGIAIDSPLAAELRRRGFIPSPRLWVRAEDVQKIQALAEPYLDEVNTVRDRIKAENPDWREQLKAPAPEPEPDEPSDFERYRSLDGHHNWYSYDS